MGLLTVAGLTACGDKVTVPPQQTTLPTTVVHNVVVSPSAASIAVGGKFTFAAAVDADAGVSNRTVTWSTSDPTVATVGTDGTVTGVKAGTVSIKATSVADATVSGAAVLTVGGSGSGGAMSVAIVSVLQNTGGVGVEQPANVLGAAGQLDVNVDVEPNGQTLKTVGVTIKVGNDSTTQTQTLSSNTASANADEASSVLTFSFNTAAFNATTGIPTLHNGTATITATATSTTTTTPAATSTVTYVLANADGVVLTNSFAPYTNAEGQTTKTSAVD
ncbi:MAG TPA: Ig-like domain-containing protein, partial [Gemmatimonadaceae bacterium]|nr:Ig-like domain-containing protein [Gemmatimonadaceae bacterium]